MNFVYLESLARDLEQKTGDTRLIASYANRIPEAQIPPHTINAAMVLVRHFESDARPFRWMLIGGPAS